jgi:hypothetical protein
MHVKTALITLGVIAIGLFAISRTSAAPYFGLTQQKGL